MSPNEMIHVDAIDIPLSNHAIIDRARDRAALENHDVKSAQQSAETSAISEKTLSEVSASLNDRLLTLNRRVDVGIDKESGHYIVTVYDTRHDVVVMQLPPESFLRLSRNLDRLTGILMDTRG